MTGSKQKIQILETNKQYSVPGSTSKRIVNSIHINPTNTIRHELAKCILGIVLSNGGLIDPNWNDIKKATELASNILDTFEYKKTDVQHFVTEAVDIHSKKRRDLVILETGEVIEVMYKHKNKHVYDEYKKDNVTCYEL